MENGTASGWHNFWLLRSCCWKKKKKEERNDIPSASFLLSTCLFSFHSAPANSYRILFKWGRNADMILWKLIFKRSSAWCGRRDCSNSNNNYHYFLCLVFIRPFQRQQRRAKLATKRLLIQIGEANKFIYIWICHWFIMDFQYFFYYYVSNASCRCRRQRWWWIFQHSADSEWPLSLLSHKSLISAINIRRCPIQSCLSYANDCYHHSSSYRFTALMHSIDAIIVQLRLMH